MAERQTIREKIYKAYKEHSRGKDDWHPTVRSEINAEITAAILEVLSGKLTKKDLEELSSLLAGYITDEKERAANFWKPRFNAD